MDRWNREGVTYKGHETGRGDDGLGRFGDRREDPVSCRRIHQRTKGKGRGSVRAYIV